MNIGAIDSYSSTPSACRWCATPLDSHGWRTGCISPDRRGERPQGWLTLARMRIRRTDPMRWIRWQDADRQYYRRWNP